MTENTTPKRFYYFTENLSEGQESILTIESIEIEYSDDNVAAHNESFYAAYDKLGKEGKVPFGGFFRKESIDTAITSIDFTNVDSSLKGEAIWGLNFNTMKYDFLRYFTNFDPEEFLETTEEVYVQFPNYNMLLHFREIWPIDHEPSHSTNVIDLKQKLREVRDVDANQKLESILMPAWLKRIVLEMGDTYNTFINAPPARSSIDGFDIFYNRESDVSSYTFYVETLPVFAIELNSSAHGDECTGRYGIGLQNTNNLPQIDVLTEWCTTQLSDHWASYIKLHKVT
jgi:hypothetical protein